MSTRSTIAVKQGKKWKIIYCHSDGYNSYMVPLLLNYYNNRKAANSIIMSIFGIIGFVLGLAVFILLLRWLTKVLIKPAYKVIIGIFKRK